MHLYKSQVVFFNIGKYTLNQHEQTMKNVSVTCVTPVPWRRERRRNVRVTD